MVWDAIPHLPCARSPAQTRETGRGLLLVEMINDRGVPTRFTSGKSVWALVVNP